MSYFEKDAIISGIGISRIGRRTDIPGLDLTVEAVRAAIDTRVGDLSSVYRWRWQNATIIAVRTASAPKGPTSR